MPINVLIPLMLQIIGLLIAGAVAVAAWGAMGFFGWLGVVLYLAGDAFTPEPVDEEKVTALTRGR